MADNSARRVECDATDLRDIIGGLRIASWNVNADGDLLLLGIEERHLVPVVDPGALPAGYPFRTARGPCPATFIAVGQDRIVQRAIPELQTVNFRIDSLPHGELLVASVLAKPESDRPNAFVYGPGGSLARTFRLGMGFSELQTTAAGDIWVSYEDEGVHGNSGWPSAPWLDDAANYHLACFDSRGNLQYSYRRPPGFQGTPGYPTHLNAGRDDLWFVDAANEDPVYGDSTVLMRLDPRGGSPEVASRLAVDGVSAVGTGRVLTWSYHFDMQTIVRTPFYALQRRSDAGADEAEEIELVRPDGTPVHKPTWENVVVARGGRLHTIDAGTHWCSCDADIAAAQLD